MCEGRGCSSTLFMAEDVVARGEETVRSGVIRFFGVNW